MPWSPLSRRLAAALLLVAGLAAHAAPIPEVPFQIRPTAYFFTLKDAADFLVARPESFDDMAQFKTSDLSYSIDEQLETVWQRYLTTNPLLVWSNARSKVVAAWVPSLGTTLDREAMQQGWPGFEEGMNIFVDMSSLPWAISNKPAMMVALRIVRIDHDQKVVVFRYLEGTPSYGEQVIEFTPSDDGPNVTDISHRTWFRAYGRVIEALYPSYHKKMINGMHGRFKQIIEGDAGP